MDPLELALIREVQQGARVLHRGPGYVVIVEGKQVNHLLHAFLTFVTCGLWGFVWLGLLLFGPKEHRYILSLDPEGRVVKRWAWNY